LRVASAHQYESVQVLMKATENLLRTAEATSKESPGWRVELNA